MKHADKNHLLADGGCRSLLVFSEMLLALALSAQELQLSVGGKELIGMCVEFPSIDDVHVVVIGASLMQGIVHVNETGG